jgi:hypothetical protein
LDFIHIIPLFLVEQHFKDKRWTARQLAPFKNAEKKAKKDRKWLAKILRVLGPNAKDSNGKFTFRITYVSILGSYLVRPYACS